MQAPPSLGMLWGGGPGPVWLLTTLAAVATVPFVLLSHKTAQAKLGWLLALFALPIAGCVGYWLVGRNWLYRRVLRLRHARGRELAPVDRTLVSALRQAVAPRGGVAREVTLAVELEGVEAPFPGNEVLPLTDGPSAFASARDAVDAAEDHIHVQTYIFRSDRTGQGMLDRLVAAARRGVTVRVLFDALGTYTTSRRFFRPLIDAGGKVAAFLPLGKGVRNLRLNLRNHRKILVVDGHTAFTGGMNIADEYAAASGWRDLHARVRGPAAAGLQRVFVEDWFFATGELLDDERWFVPARPVGDVPVQVVASGPDLKDAVMESLYFAAIAGARRRIDLLTPYFVPTEPLEAALADAARRGRAVRVLLPERTDHLPVRLAHRVIVPRLMAEGVEFFGYPKMLHAKAMCVDDAWGTLGSANFDNRSFRLNFEVNVAFPHAPTALRLRQVLDDQFVQARRLTMEDFHQGLAGRLLSNTAALLGPIL